MEPKPAKINRLVKTNKKKHILLIEFIGLKHNAWMLVEAQRKLK